MASKINQPTGFIKLTNVAFIKYRVDKLKFEIACYKNKAINWRNGVEKDISEVLQSDEIYENATHGIIAKKNELVKIFPKMEKMDIIKMILEKGELQVSEKEREQQVNNLTKDIINIVAEKIVHPQTQRQFAIDSITQAIQDIHFNIRTDQPAKKQALLCIHSLQEKYQIARAKMRISMTSAKKNQEKILNLLKTLMQENEEVIDQDSKVCIICRIEPQAYRPLIDGLKQLSTSITTEVLENNVVNKVVEDIQSVQTAELKIRDDWVENSQNTKANENDDQEEEDVKKIKNKKQRKKQHNKQLKEEKEKEEQLQQHNLNKEFLKYNGQHGNLDFSDINKQLLEEKKQQLKQQQQQNLQGKEQEEQKQSQQQQQQQVKTGKKCMSCKDACFEDAQEFRNHYKSDWHVTNVKRKTQQLPPYTFQEFQIAQLDEQFKK